MVLYSKQFFLFLCFQSYFLFDLIYSLSNIYFTFYEAIWKLWWVFCGSKWQSFLLMLVFFFKAIWKCVFCILWFCKSNFVLFLYISFFYILMSIFIFIKLSKNMGGHSVVLHDKQVFYFSILFLMSIFIFIKLSGNMWWTFCGGKQQKLRIDKYV